MDDEIRHGPISSFTDKQLAAININITITKVRSVYQGVLPTEDVLMSSIANRNMPLSNVPESLQSVRTVAAFLAVSRSKVYQLMETGELSFVKIGKCRRVRWSDVLKLVETNTVVGS